MTLTPAMLDALLVSGCTPEQIVAVVKIDMQEREQAAEQRRAKDTERQRRHRASRDVTVTECDETDDPSLSRPFPPQTPPNPTHTHPDIYTPREAHVLAWREWREKNPFPRPWWAPKQVWADWMDVRKAKKARNTITAHAGFLRDVEKHTNDEWPPGRLLEHAVARSWLSINRPEERSRHGLPAQRTDLRPSAGSRGERRNPLLDLVRATEAEDDPESYCQPDWQGRPPLRALGQG